MPFTIIDIQSPPAIAPAVITAITIIATFLLVILNPLHNKTPKKHPTTAYMYLINHPPDMPLVTASMR